MPDVIEAHAGDEITIHVTNVEQTTDMIHGLGIVEHDMNVVIDPGETKTVRFKATKTGVYPVLLHQLLLGAAPGDAGLPRRQAVAVHRRTSDHDTPSFAPSLPLPRIARCRAASRGVVLLGIAALCSAAVAAAVADPAGRAAVPGGADARDVQPQDRRRQRRPGPAEINTLNHYIGMKPIVQADFAEMTWMPFAIGDLRACSPCGRQ